MGYIITNAVPFTPVKILVRVCINASCKAMHQVFPFEIGKLFFSSLIACAYLENFTKQYSFSCLVNSFNPGVSNVCLVWSSPSFSGLFNISDKLLVSYNILLEWREEFKRGVPLTAAIESKLGILLQKSKQVVKQSWTWSYNIKTWSVANWHL